jgi:hypothetical protein
MAAHGNGLGQAFGGLRAYLMEYGIVTRTLKAKNIVYQILKKKSGAGVGRLVIIDNIGNTEFLPLANYVGFFARRKTTRQWARFERDYLKEFGGSDALGVASSGGAPKVLP